METLKLIKIPQAHHFLPCQPAPHLASSNAQLTLNLESLYVYTVKAGWILNLIIMSEDATSFTSTLITAPLNSFYCPPEVRRKYCHCYPVLDQNIPRLFT